MTCGSGIAGPNGKPYISVDGGTTFIVVSKVTDMSMARTQSPIDTSNFDSVDMWKEFIEGWKDWSSDISAIYLPTDQGQIDILESLDSGACVKFQYRPDNTVGAKMWEGDVIVKDWSLNSQKEEAVSVAMSLQGSGKPVAGVVA